MLNQATSGYVDMTYMPFYHQKCPNCGYCPYCGRRDEPFKDHWFPPPTIGDPIAPADPSITWTSSITAPKQDIEVWYKDYAKETCQAEVPSSNSQFTRTTAAIFVTNDSDLKPRI